MFYELKFEHKLWFVKHYSHGKQLYPSIDIYISSDDEYKNIPQLNLGIWTDSCFICCPVMHSRIAKTTLWSSKILLKTKT